MLELGTKPFRFPDPHPSVHSHSDWGGGRQSASCHGHLQPCTSAQLSASGSQERDEWRATICPSLSTGKLQGCQLDQNVQLFPSQGTVQHESVKLASTAVRGPPGDLQASDCSLL